MGIKQEAPHRFSIVDRTRYQITQGLIDLAQEQENAGNYLYLPDVEEAKHIQQTVLSPIYDSRYTSQKINYQRIYSLKGKDGYGTILRFGITTNPESPSEEYTFICTEVFSSDNPDEQHRAKITAQRWDELAGNHPPSPVISTL